ncbi:MAG TPA: HEAT repeat domain-containing protein [Planctomycetota bacterium]|nr:HEAT repeat domain-containing protein [Planctomycetota bacterium]
MLRLLCSGLASLLLLALIADRPAAAAEPEKPAAAPDGKDEEDKPLTPEELAKINARVVELIKQLASDDWAKREEATTALIAIGNPAVPALEEAAKSPDAETATRAAEALQKIKGAPKRRKKKFDPNCTDGYQAVYEGREHVQTFKATTDKLDFLRIRTARTINNPMADLTISLRESGKENAEALATATASSTEVTRFYRWFTMELKAEKLEKGKTYELVFTSGAAKSSPWLVNCFYRDAYPDGEYRELADGKPVKSEKRYDLVFELGAGEDKTTSVPKGTDLTKKDEHFGVGPDGTDLYQDPPKVPVEEGGAL